nr:lebocin-4-like [Maniola hyperantus]
MIKILSILVLTALVADTFGQRFIHPTYRPPPRRPVIIRTVRDVSDQPLWLYQGDIPRAPASGDHPVLPTIIDDVKLDPNRRYARDVNDQPLWLYQGDIPRAPATGDHPVLPTIIDDVKLDPNQRYARSVDSPSARRSGGGSRSTGHHDTGRTHPGYNRRNARNVEFTQRPGWPKPRPTVGPVRPFPRPQPLSPFS